MRRQPKGSRYGGRFAPDMSGSRPPEPSDEPKGRAPDVEKRRADISGVQYAYDAYLREQQEANPMLSDDKCPECDNRLPKSGPHICPKLNGRLRCDACQRWMPEDGHHNCPARMKPWFQRAALVAPAATAVGVFGISAAALALGPIAVGVVAGALAVGIAGRGLMERFARRAMWQKAANQQDTYLFQHSNVQWLDAEKDRLATEMGVKGDVHLYVSPDENSGPAALHVAKDKSVIIVPANYVDLPREQQSGILAHEMAHLQAAGRRAGRVKRFFGKAAMPVAIGVAAVSGMAALPAAGVAAVIWYGGKMVSSAVSRREERRADAAAYEKYGEVYAEALTDYHAKKKGHLRSDLPWRAEDIVFTHGNLPNRIADMRASSAAARA